MPPSANARRAAWAAAFAALFALVQAALWIAYYGNGAKALIGDEESYKNFALAILGGGPWMPSTIWPPLQALFIAAVYALAGPHVLAVQLVQTLLLVASALLLRRLWRRVGGTVAAANLAGALFLLNPSTAAYAHWLWPEVTHLALVLAAFCLLFEVHDRWRAPLAGAAVGLALLAKSLLTAFWPAFLVAFADLRRRRFAFRPAAAFLLGLAIVTAPALWHGVRSYGRPMIADSSVYNLWIGLTDTKRSDYVADMGGATLPAFLASADTPEARNALYLDKVRTLLAERGVLHVLADQLGRQYFRLFSAKTPLVSQLPGRACAGHLSAYRAPAWLGGALTFASNVFHALILAAAALGIACWRRKPDALFCLIALYGGYQLALLLLVHVKARFLFPMMPFLAGFAASFLAAVFRREESSRTAGALLALTPPRIAIGALLAALLLFLAFAGPALDGLCAG